jgi:hypothetical protein
MGIIPLFAVMLFARSSEAVFSRESYYLMEVGMWNFILILIITFMDFIRKGELLLCSLPLKRTGIVRARYVSSVILTFSLLLYVFLLLLLFNQIFINSIVDLPQIFNLNALAIYFIKICVFMSVAIPLFYKVRSTGSVIFAQGGLLLFFIGGNVILEELKIRGMDFGIGEALSSSTQIFGIPVYILVLFIIVVILNVMSVKLSVRYFEKREI